MPDPSIILGLVRKNAGEEKVLQEKGDFDGAIQKSQECIRLLKMLADMEPGYQSITAENLKAWQTRVEKLKKKYSEGKKNINNSSYPSSKGGVTDVYDEEIRRTILGLIHMGNDKLTWNGIGGMEEEKKLIKKIEFFQTATPPGNVQIFSGQKNLLLYGPPGTGKTILARVVASNIKATFFNAPYDKLVSRYVGDSSRLVSKLFQIAREKAPSVIFLDDVESLLLSRDKYEKSNESGVLTTFLTSIDGLEKSDKNVLLIAATNKPWMLDEAILSRFYHRVYVPLPDAAAREKIIQIGINGKGLKYDGDYWELAKDLEGFSGREISLACENAIMQMLERANPNIYEKIDHIKDMSEIKRMVYKVLPVSKDEMKDSFKSIKKSVSRESIGQFERWKAEKG